MKRLIYSNFANIVIALALGISAIFGLWLLVTFILQILKGEFDGVIFVALGSAIIFLGISFALARVLDLEKPEKPDM